MLEVKALKKSYGKVVAVDGVSLRAGAGETIGLLGPNGAGKTTTVSMIAGLFPPDSGEILIDGSPLRGDTDPVKRKIGLVPQNIALYDELTALDNLIFLGALYELHGAAIKRAIADALDLVGLSDRAKDKVGTFSGGMKRRLNLAAALLHDPQSRNAIFDNLETLKKRGKTLLYTTHYMEEAERLCDRIIIIDHGKVIANDTLNGLHRMLPISNVLAVELEKPDAFQPAPLRALPEVVSAEMKEGVLRVGLHELTSGAPPVLRWLSENGYAYQHVTSERPDLETVFLTLTGRSLRDA